MNSFLKILKASLVSGFILLSGFSIEAFAQPEFPLHPHPKLTPGSLCDDPDSYRYPEKIPYCKRDVETKLKLAIIDAYKRQLGYRIEKRADYKVDHYIPLCMGGSNKPTNLWPQHKSIYPHTDPLEGLLCEKMRDGRIEQDEAIELIKKAKHDVSQARNIIRYVESL